MVEGWELMAVVMVSAGMVVWSIVRGEKVNPMHLSSVEHDLRYTWSDPKCHA